MESLFLLVPIALIFVVIALRILFWALNSGQYDNLDTEAHRILFDEDEKSLSNSIKDKPESDTETSSALAQKITRPDTAQKLDLAHNLTINVDTTINLDVTHKEQGDE